MSIDLAARRIEAFRQRHGEPHYLLAMHAAFPLALTPDWLYQCWATFSSDIHKEKLDIPWIAVADILLSGLCQPAGFELYQMDKDAQALLLQALRDDPRFGLERLKGLYNFTLDYYREDLESQDYCIQAYAQEHKTIAFARLKTYALIEKTDEPDPISAEENFLRDCYERLGWSYDSIDECLDKAEAFLKSSEPPHRKEILREILLAYEIVASSQYTKRIEALVNDHPSQQQSGWHLRFSMYEHPIIVDFNRSQYGLPVQIGEVTLEREKRWYDALIRWPWKTALKLAIPNNGIRFHSAATGGKLVWKEGLLGVGAPGKTEYEDRRAVNGSSYPLLFDASKIVEVETADPRDMDGSLQFWLNAQPYPAESNPAMKLRLLPERAKFHFEEELWLERKPDSSGHAAIFANYGKGKPLRLAGYVLENRVAHAFSEPAQGQWRLSARALDGKALAAGAFYLEDMDEPPDSRVRQSSINYVLRKAAKKKIGLVADLKALGNPLPNETREYEIKLIDQDSKSVAEHRFALERSDQRTFIQMALLDHAGNTVQEYDEERHPSGSSLPLVDLSGSLQNISEDVPGRQVLFGLKLANRCEDGAGYANWRVLLDDPAGNGIYCPLDAFEIADQAEGTLYDDTNPARREKVLTVALDPGGPQFDQRESWLDLPLRVEFEKYEDGRKGGRQILPWQTTVRLGLRHMPPRRVLAIDFGTSAIAVAYATDEEPQFFPISRQVSDAQSKLSQQLENNNPTLLSADASLAVNLNNPSRPNTSNYLDLPANAAAAVRDVDTIIPSLKMLLVRNYNYLPINPRQYPYMDSRGNIENRVDHRPPLDDVLRGVFEKLRNDYIKPNFGGLLPYTYLVATHPNTYTAVERNRFAQILKDVFVGQSSYHQLYAENIHLLSESDAVINYYLFHAAGYHKAQGRELTANETVLIWDIGAGTLDMTLAAIKREALPGGGWETKKITIHDRHSVEAAGNMLTECIVRDLDQYLYDNIGDAYVLPLVKREDKLFLIDKTDESIFRVIYPLRLQIEEYKRMLAAGTAEAKIQLYGNEYQQGESYISLANKDYYDKYMALADLEVTGENSIYWKPSLDAPFVNAFVKRVAESEVELFVGNARDWQGAPMIIDTVVISGRTSLWPGLLDRLRNTLPTVASWIQLTHDPKHSNHDPSVSLKNVVAAGAAIGQIRLQANIERIAPSMFGTYAIRYELDGINNWQYVDLPDNQTIDLNMPNAHICQIGVHHAGRFKVFFEFPLRSVTAGNSKIQVTMSSDHSNKNASFRCRIKNTSGAELIVDEGVASLMKPQVNIKVWPITILQLPYVSPEYISKVDTIP